MIDRIETILKLRQEIMRRCAPRPAPGSSRPRTLAGLSDLGAAPAAARAPGLLQTDLDTLLPKNFLEIISFERLAQIPRYLKALLVRAERSSVNPVKDRERAAIVSPWVEALRKFQTVPGGSDNFRVRLDEFRWMIEEFRVSLFAQELGTAIPVSPKRLEEQLSKLRQAADGWGCGAK